MGCLLGLRWAGDDWGLFGKYVGKNGEEVRDCRFLGGQLGYPAQTEGKEGTEDSKVERRMKILTSQKLDQAARYG